MVCNENTHDEQVDTIDNNEENVIPEQDLGDSIINSPTTHVEDDLQELMNHTDELSFTSVRGTVQNIVRFCAGLPYHYVEVNELSQFHNGHTQIVITTGAPHYCQVLWIVDVFLANDDSIKARFNNFDDPSRDTITEFDISRMNDLEGFCQNL